MSKTHTHEKQHRSPHAPPEAASLVKVSYHTIPTPGLRGSYRLYRHWHTTDYGLVPRSVKTAVRVGDEYVYVEMLCQHPGTMYYCIEKAEASRRRWLQWGDPSLPAGEAGLVAQYQTTALPDGFNFDAAIPGHRQYADTAMDIPG